MSWRPSFSVIMVGRRRRWRRCSWRSRPPWRPGMPSTNPAAWPSSAPPGTTQAAETLGGPRRGPGHDQPSPATRSRSRARQWTRSGWRRRRAGCWRRWRSAARPGRAGMSAPRRNATSGPPTVPSRQGRAAGRAARRRGAADPVDLVGSARRRRRRAGGVAAGRRLERLHRCRLRAVHLRPDPGRRAATRRHRGPHRRPRPGRRRRWSWRCWNQPRTGAAWTPGRRLWFVPCAPPGRGCSWRSPRPAPGRPPPCAPWPGPGPTAAATVVGLAPSAAAAAQLRDATGAPADTLAKLTWSIDHDDAARLGGPHRPVHVGDHRRGRDGRHPLPGHRRRRSSSAAAAVSGWSVTTSNSPRSAPAGCSATSKPATARSGSPSCTGSPTRPRPPPPSPSATADPKRSASTSTGNASTSATPPPSPTASSPPGSTTAAKAWTRSCWPRPASWSAELNQRARDHRLAGTTAGPAGRRWPTATGPASAI